MIVRQAPEWLSNWEYAHRGLHSDGVPENTLEAAEAAIAAGMAIECDVQRSRDGQLAVFHDWELERLTGRSGLTEEFTGCELEALTYVGSGEKPIMLPVLLEAVHGRVPLLIEIKSRPGYDIEQSCEIATRELASYNGEYAVMSFDPLVAEWFAVNSPQTVRGLVCTDTLDLGFLGAWREPGALEAADPDFLAMDIRDLPNAFASLWRSSGRPLLSWTIRSSQLRQKALIEVDALISEGEGLA